MLQLGVREIGRVTCQVGHEEMAIENVQLAPPNVRPTPNFGSSAAKPRAKHREWPGPGQGITQLICSLEGFGQIKTQTGQRDLGLPA